MIVKRIIIFLILILSVSFISCNNAIQEDSPDEIYDSPTIKGIVAVPSMASISLSDLKVLIKVGETTVFTGRLHSDGSFVVSNLDAFTSYSVLITSDSTARDASAGPEGWGCWKRDVKPTAGEGMDVGSLEIRPLGAIVGCVRMDGPEEHYGIDVYIPGSSYIAKTDINGNYVINNVPQGSYQIRFEKSGYVADMIDVTLMSNDISVNPVETIEGTIILAKDIFDISKNGFVSLKSSEVSYVNTLTSLIIPEQIDGTTVRGIGDSAFSGCATLKTITIPDTVESIGNSAFSGCTSLETVSIPDTVVSIGDSAFLGCTSLETIELPDELTSIRDHVFENCLSLKTVVLPSAIESIGVSAFRNSGLTSIAFPSSLKSIHSAFRECGKLVDVSYEGSVSEWNELDIYYMNANYASVIHCSDGDVANPDYWPPS